MGVGDFVPMKMHVRVGDSVPMRMPVIELKDALEPKELLRDDLAQKINNGKVEIGEYSIGYEKNEYWEGIRIFKDYKNQILLHLEKGKITKITGVSSYENMISLLSDLIAKGIIKEEKLDIPKADIEKAKENAKMIDEMNNWLNKNNGSFDISQAYDSEYLSKSTAVVAQGEGFIIKNPSSKDALYTFGAGPCSIMIVVDKDKNGKVNAIGLAHIDSVTPSTSIANFINRFSKNAEITIISGDTSTITKIYPAIKDRNAKINVDLAGDRSDAAGIDGSGKIYYGDNSALNNKLDSRKMEVRGTQAAMGGELPLQIYFKEGNRQDRKPLTH